MKNAKYLINNFLKFKKEMKLGQESSINNIKKTKFLNIEIDNFSPIGFSEEVNNLN